MERKMLKKLLIVLTIIMLTATDFFMLGTGLVSYAESLENATNNDNVEFSTYFKNANGEKVQSLETSVNKEDLKLYAEIAVKSEGYFNGEIELSESNFKIKSNIQSSYINKVEGNKITLNQINAGNKAEIEIPVEAISSETIRLDNLTMESKIKLTGTYMEKKAKERNIKSERTVNLKILIDSETKAELTTEIITNKTYKVNEENKRIIQLGINANITNNNYPIKQTTIKTNIPQLGKDVEDVKVFAMNTKSTNGLVEELSKDNWKVENGVVEISVKNDANSNNEVSWNKNSSDRYIVTFIFAEDVDTSKLEITSKAEMTVYNSENVLTAESIAKLENTELNNIIVSTAKLDNTDMYKGQLYANAKSENKKEINFNTTTSIEIRNIEVEDIINVKEEKDVFTTTSTDIDANTRYIKTVINKADMLKHFGEDGFVIIKSGDSVYYKLDKDSTTDENGNIVIIYDKEVHELEISTSKPVLEGIFEIAHTKSIMANNYGTELIRGITGLKVKNTINATLKDVKVVENTTEISKELKETTSQAEFTVNKTNLSTMTENKDVIIGVKLRTDSTKYDLYKNPTIKIQLPKCVEELTVNSFDKLYGSEFAIEKATYSKSNRLIEVVLKGEQTEYIESATQLYLQINANMKLDQTTASKTDKITMEYSNENAIVKTSTIEKEIGIVAPSGLIAINNIENYDIQGISGTSTQKQLATVDKNTAGGTDAEMRIAVINNTDTTANNVSILGNFPTEGRFNRGNEVIENTFDTTLKSGINAGKAKVYYSANENATADLNKSSNGWTTNINELQDVKTYLIKAESIKPEESFVATYAMSMPQTLSYDETSYSGYQVTYNEEQTSIKQTRESTLVGLSTGESVKLEANMSATVGNDTLKSGDKVKAGEVIKYSIKVKNNGTSTLSNIVVNGQVPTGTVQVVPKDNYVYEDMYYQELTNTTVSSTIASLGAGEETTVEYEVRVKVGITNGAEISNKATITCNEQSVDSNELKNTLETGKIRVTLKRALDESLELNLNSTMEYMLYIENITDETIENLNVNLLPSNMDMQLVIDSNVNEIAKNTNEFTINSIEPNKRVSYRVYGKVFAENVDEIKLSANVIDTESNTYRSNNIIAKVENVGASIKISSPTAGNNIKSGDEVVYNIEVKNTGSTEQLIRVESNIPEELEIKQISINGETKLQTTDFYDINTYMEKISNQSSIHVSAEAGKTYTVTITAVVKEFENKTIKTISNSAKAIIANKEQAQSGEVSHIINTEGSVISGNIINGVAWIDGNSDGQKDDGEQLLEGMTVKLLNVTTNKIVSETKTNASGEYSFVNVDSGEYLVLFEYDTNQYEPTIYKKEGVLESKNSNVVEKSVTIDGQEKTYGVTDTINLVSSVSNINIGLRERKIYDLELQKFISKATVQTTSGTKTYNYKDSTFEKVEINRKRINGATVILEYTIRVKNTGEIAGYVTNIRDYLPSGLEFSSELNPDWYVSGQDLYTKSLSNTRIEPGETKEVKLILTKKTTEDTVGLINNRAEIAEEYNELGKVDIDSTANNQATGEDDIGSADVFIGVSTGGRTFAYIVLIMINTALIGLAIYLIFIKNRNKR